jgi:hypothetical protein
VTSEISWVNRTDRSFAQGLNRTLKESEAEPQGLKPTIKTMAYRSGKPLRHPKSGVFQRTVKPAFPGRLAARLKRLRKNSIR